MSDVEEKIQEEIKAKKSNIQMGFSGLQGETVFPSDSPKEKEKNPSYRVSYTMIDHQTRIESINKQVGDIISSINIDATEDRHIHVMCQLLHELSENQNEKADNFYTGNMPIQEVSIWTENNNQLKTKTPVIKISQQRYYQIFRNANRIGGNDIKTINKSLNDFSKKHFKMTLQIPMGKNSKGEHTFDVFIHDAPLFQVVRIYTSVTGEEIVSIEDENPELLKQKGEFLFTLHPILRHYIETNYINYPIDLYPRIQEVLGGKKQTISIIQLRNWLMKQLRNIKLGKYPEHIEINENNLNKLLGLEKKIKNREYKRANERRNEAIDVLKKVGLIFSCNEVMGKEGQKKYIFHINKDFE